MLVLSRMKNERIYIGDDIEVVVVEIRGDRVRIGIDAPRHVHVVRDDAICRVQKAAEEGRLNELEQEMDREENNP